MKRAKIIDTVDVLNNEAGIFQTIFSMNAFEWLTEDMAKAFDFDYYISYSSDKIISYTYLKLLVLEEAGKIPSALGAIAKIILNRYQADWDKIYETMMADFNPLDNYKLKEVETPDITKTRTSDFKSTTDNNLNGFGFNTTEADGVPVDKGVVSVYGTSDDNVVNDTETGTRTREKEGYDVHPADNIYKTLSLLELNLFELLAKDVDGVMADLFYS